MAPATDRQQFRALVADVAARAKAILPVSTNGRVEAAMKLVLLDEVQPQDDGSICVGSCSDPAKVYHLVGTTCDCADFPRAPESWCKHRIAAGLHKRVRELMAAQAVTAPPAQALGEAPCSVNCHVTIAGRQVQLTLRGHDEAEVLTRLEKVLARCPQPQTQAQAPAPQPEEKRFCPRHGSAMQQNHKEGRSWWSHRTADGWCRGK